MKRASGFTLVEVMVAMAVVAVALPALLVAMDQQIDNTGYLRDKTLAQMVASNKLAETRLIVAATRTLGKGKDDGVMTMADRDWYWRSEIKTTAVPNYFQVEIAVAAQEGDKVDPLYTLVGYMSGDLRTDPGGSGSN
ncbi:MAG: general secretion pathway protein I [Bacteroidia bacterium]|jgi:general secretion pathway protein I